MNVGRCSLVLVLVACGGDDGRSPSPDADGPTTLEPTVVPNPDTALAGPTLPPFDADFLWDTLRFEDVVDLGHTAGPLPEEQRVPPGAVTLTEVGESAGLGETMSGGNSHGVGVGFFDTDGDGWEDIVLANGFDGVAYPSRLFRNQGDGTFVDASVASGFGALLADLDTYAVAAADFDGDGDLDIHVTAHPTDKLLQNQGDGTFRDVTAAAGAGGPPSERDGSGSSKIGAFGDVDGDGWLDLAVASSTFVDQPANGYLLRNRGDGTFADVTAASGFAAAPTGNPCAVLWSDSDNDGDQDLWIWNDRGDRNENRVLLINQGGTFVDRTVEAGLTNEIRNPMGIDGADLDRDGFLDYYLGNIGHHPLWMAQGDGTYIDGSLAAGTGGDYGWGLGFEDLNADSWWDLFVAQEDDRPYFVYTHVRSVPPTFLRTEVGHAPVGDGHNVAVAFADFDHDQDVDMVSAPTSGARLSLFRNDTYRGTNAFLEVRVSVTPGTGERGGVSGRVVVKTGELVQFRDLTAGSSRASQNAVSVRFGLGQWTGADWVAVLWPDGRQLAAMNVEGNQAIELGG